ncbi:MAG: CapA family protein [Cyclobacteriaceae bacterium]|jgi:poly-gamma-glutamate capsule biosynthesis protein CapA/YwtB (metallophosphatase superfamily)|nr:CapA family protein [Cyclobacteriaceae bacterium]
MNISGAFVFSFCLALAGTGWAQKKDTVSIIGVGDIMMGSNYPTEAGLPPRDGADLFSEVAAILSSADVTMGNLEGVLLDQGGTAKTCKNPSVCYVFRTPERYGKNLWDAGFDVMSLANNHAGDFGDVGRKSSMKTLDALGIAHAGLVSQPYTVFQKDGITYGFTAFAPNSGCNNLNDWVSARKIVAKLDSLADIVIVSFHGGAEGPTHQHVTRKNEIFYGENRGNVYEFAHRMIDAGADVIFGHGPHVVRAVEVYKDRFIAYSLGNFMTYGGINVAGINGYAPIIKVFTDSRGAFQQARIYPGIQTFRAAVKIDPQKAALSRIKQLTEQDFPQSGLTIDEIGWVKKSTK